MSADMRAPTPTVPSLEPIPEITPSAPPATPQTPPVIPPISEHLLHMSLGLLYQFLSIEAYATLSRHWPLLRASLLSRSQLLVLIRSRLSPLDPAHCHLEANSTPSGYSIDS